MTADITRTAPNGVPPAQLVLTPPAAAEQPKTVAVAAKPKDRRVAALLRFALSISAFNVLGYLFLGFEQAPITPFVCVGTGYAAALLLETLDAWAHRRRPGYAGGWRAFGVFLLPAHITGLACGMLLYGNSVLWPYVLAVLIGISSKYVVRFPWNGRTAHPLNPSNAGIAVVLIVFPWVGIAPPYQFTNYVHGTISWLIPLGILMAGTMVNAKLTRKMPLILAWVGGFVLQALLRWAILDQNIVAMLLPLTGVAFILYTNYMITDPGSTPVRTRNQVAFGLCVGLVYGVLVVSGVAFGLFFALLITCGLRGMVLAASAVRASRRTAPSGKDRPA